MIENAQRDLMVGTNQNPNRARTLEALTDAQVILILRYEAYVDEQGVFRVSPTLDASQATTGEA